MRLYFKQDGKTTFFEGGDFVSFRDLETAIREAKEKKTDNPGYRV